jgi:hypothetical protein
MPFESSLSFPGAQRDQLGGAALAFMGICTVGADVILTQGGQYSIGADK